MKITIIPFLIGCYIVGFAADNYDFANAATLLLVILGITKNLDWI